MKITGLSETGRFANVRRAMVDWSHFRSCLLGFLFVALSLFGEEVAVEAEIHLLANRGYDGKEMAWGLDAFPNGLWEPFKEAENLSGTLHLTPGAHGRQALVHSEGTRRFHGIGQIGSLRDQVKGGAEVQLDSGLWVPATLEKVFIDLIGTSQTSGGGMVFHNEVASKIEGKYIYWEFESSSHPMRRVQRFVFEDVLGGKVRPHQKSYWLLPYESQYLSLELGLSRTRMIGMGETPSGETLYAAWRDLSAAQRSGGEVAVYAGLDNVIQTFSYDRALGWASERDKSIDVSLVQGLRQVAEPHVGPNRNFRATARSLKATLIRQELLRSFTLGEFSCAVVLGAVHGFQQRVERSAEWLRTHLLR